MFDGELSIFAADLHFGIGFGGETNAGVEQETEEVDMIGIPSIRISGYISYI